MGFNIDYDDELMAAFERFRQQNVTDLILDLRYNNGGDVLSSAVLGTLVAGNATRDRFMHIPRSMKTARKPVKAVTTRSASRKQLSAYTNRSKRRFSMLWG